MFFSYQLERATAIREEEAYKKGMDGVLLCLEKFC